MCQPLHSRRPTSIIIRPSTVSRHTMRLSDRRSCASQCYHRKSSRSPGGTVTHEATNQKIFNYVVLGHAGTLAGLAAPYDEENTDEVMFLEELSPGVDVFSFWQANANSDLVTGRHKEVRELERR